MYCLCFTDNLSLSSLINDCATDRIGSGGNGRGGGDLKVHLSVGGNTNILKDFSHYLLCTICMFDIK